MICKIHLKYQSGESPLSEGEIFPVDTNDALTHSEYFNEVEPILTTFYTDG